MVYSDNQDLWQATRPAPDAAFQNHQKLDTVNTENIDTFPYLANNGDLYFVPNSVRNGGGWQLFKTGEELTHPRFDVNRDGGEDVDDVDAMCRNLSRSRFSDLWDFDANGEVGRPDLVETLNHLGFSEGDANLDQLVDFADFLILAENFGTSSRFWSKGNFNCDKSVGFDDFLVLSANYDQTPELIASVPEPNQNGLCGMLLLLGVSTCRKRRNPKQVTPQQD